MTYKEIIDNYLVLWKAKHNDYGPANIGLFGERGVVVRACDKYARLYQYYVEGAEMQNEGIMDSWQDLLGYGLIGMVCASGAWPLFELVKRLVGMAREILLVPQRGVDIAMAKPGYVEGNMVQAGRIVLAELEHMELTRLWNTMHRGTWQQFLTMIGGRLWYLREHHFGHDETRVMDKDERLYHWRALAALATVGIYRLTGDKG